MRRQSSRGRRTPSPRSSPCGVSFADMVVDLSRPPSVNSLHSHCSNFSVTQALTGPTSAMKHHDALLELRRYLLRQFGSAESAFADADLTRRVQRLSRAQFEHVLVHRWSYCN